MELLLKDWGLKAGNLPRKLTSFASLIAKVASNFVNVFFIHAFCVDTTARESAARSLPSPKSANKPDTRRVSVLFGRHDHIHHHRHQQQQHQQLSSLCSVLPHGETLATATLRFDTVALQFHRRTVVVPHCKWHGSSRRPVGRMVATSYTLNETSWLRPIRH